MAFSNDVVLRAWRRSDGKCECGRSSHNHLYVRCNKELVWENRGREGRGAWEAHHIDSDGDDTGACERSGQEQQVLGLFSQETRRRQWPKTGRLVSYSQQSEPDPRTVRAIQ
mgnify:CR=1 FL=1